MARTADRPYYTPNGMNLVLSEKSPNSRLAKIVRYLALNGPSRKRDILRNGLAYPKAIAAADSKTWSGWGANAFRLAVKYGHVTKVRKDRTVYWVVNPRSNVLGPEGVA